MTLWKRHFLAMARGGTGGFIRLRGECLVHPVQDCAIPICIRWPDVMEGVTSDGEILGNQCLCGAPLTITTTSTPELAFTDEFTRCLTCGFQTSRSYRSCDEDPIV